MNTFTTLCDSAATSQKVIVSRKVAWIQTLTQYIVACGLAYLSYLLVSHFILQSVKVVGSSMIPTLKDSEHYILNRWVYHVHSPKPTDIVVLRDPSDQGFSVKRVVAVAGDSVYFKGGRVFVNGHQLNETYLEKNTPTYTFDHNREQMIICGKEQYFLLGDNRQNSLDSRFYGPVPRANILGMVVH
jgi:signal peptidase I